MEKKQSRCYCIINSLGVAHLIPLSSTVNYSAFIGGASLTLSGGVQLIEPLKDIRDHERRRPGGAVLSGDVGLLSEARGHVVHDGHDDAHWLLGHRDTLGQLQLWDQTHGGSEVQVYVSCPGCTELMVRVCRDLQRRASWT